MTRLSLVILVCAGVSLLFFPSLLTALLALLAAPAIPLAPLALGVAADALYWSPPAFPIASVAGALVSTAAFFLHARLQERIVAS